MKIIGLQIGIHIKKQKTMGRYYLIIMLLLTSFGTLKIDFN